MCPQRSNTRWWPVYQEQLASYDKTFETQDGRLTVHRQSRSKRNECLGSILSECLIKVQLSWEVGRINRVSIGQYLYSLPLCEHSSNA